MATPGSSFLQTEVPAQQQVAFGVGPSTQRPISPVNGFVYSDTTLNVIVQWTGVVWNVIGQQAQLPLFGGNTRPTNPPFPALNFNTVTGQLEAWSGSAWVVIGPIAAPPPPTVAAPQITSQPTGQTVAIGASNVTFTVSATGAGSLTYQWYLNGVTLSGATGASYVISTAAQSNGGVYTVTVTGAGGSTGSLGATLVVNGAPFITSQPASQTVATNGTVSFSVGITGTAPLVYQWYLNGVAILGATSSTYTIGSVAGANAGSYTVTVTNGSGSVTSNAATLTVTPAPYQASWTSYSGAGLIASTSDVIFGFILHGASLGASTVGVQLSVGMPFPPGVTYSVYPGGSSVPVFSGTSSGGETTLSTVVNVPTTADVVSYTVVCSFTTNVVIIGSISVASGPALFHNSSVRASAVGAVILPPSGFDVGITVPTLAPGSVVNYLFYQAVSHTYWASPYSWNFNGNTSAPNPQTGVVVGGNFASLVGNAPPSGIADSVIEIDATGS